MIRPAGPLAARVVALLAAAASPAAPPSIPEVARQTAPPLEDEPDAADAPAPAPKRDEPSLFVRFGWSNTVLCERFGPLTVTVSNPTTRALVGTISVEFDQDATQPARITASVAATPGRDTRVQLVCGVPFPCDRIEVTYRGPKGEVHARSTFAVGPGKSSLDNAMPRLRCGPGAVLVIRDRTRSAGGSVLAPIRPALERHALQSDRAGAFFPLAVDVADLPHAWAAYDGLAVVALHASDTGALDPRARVALRQWVRSGGRLILVADSSDALPDSWLADADGRALANAEPLARVTMPREVIEEAVSAPSQDVDGGESPIGRPPPIAPGLPARVLTVTPRGHDLGWRAFWPTSTNAHAEHDRSGLAATGPLGLGWVLVLGLDPRRVCETVDAPTHEHLWQRIVERIGQDALGEATRADSPIAWHGYGAGQGEDALTAFALSSLVGWYVRVRPPGLATFYGLLGLMGLLAVCLGPLDYALLGRLRARHRSWMSALIWIGLASALGYGSPRVLRPGSESVSAVSIYDAVMSPMPLGNGLSSPVRVEASARAGFASVFADHSRRARLEGATTGGFTRGFATIDADPGAARPLGPLATTYTPPPIAPDGSAAMSASLAPSEADLLVWTLRSMLESSIEDPGITAWVDPAPDAPLLRVRGLPLGARIARAIAMIGSEAWTPREESGSPAGDSRDGIALTRVSFRDDDWSGSDGARAPSSAPFNPMGSPSDLLLALQVPGPNRRGLVASRLRSLDPRRWAVVYLAVENWPGRVGIAGEAADARTTHAAIFRLTVPIRSDPGSDGP
ncbi:MAG: hypothetical protein JNM07_06460 [Phycisphaerae bacterium]|nr:hypothetical protein [Phycisphaerae bacterium]